MLQRCCRCPCIACRAQAEKARQAEAEKAAREAERVAREAAKAAEAAEKARAKAEKEAQVGGSNRQQRHVHQPCLNDTLPACIMEAPPMLPASLR